jgi:hypothetical protein
VVKLPTDSEPVDVHEGPPDDNLAKPIDESTIFEPDKESLEIRIATESASVDELTSLLEPFTDIVVSLISTNGILSPDERVSPTSVGSSENLMLDILDINYKKFR